MDEITAKGMLETAAFLEQEARNLNIAAAWLRRRATEAIERAMMIPTGQRELWEEGGER